jgi:PAS domain-containing protein
MTEAVDRGLLYQKIVEDSPMAILYADREGVIRFWNAGAEVMFGYTAAEAVGQSLDLIVPEKQRPRQWDGWNRVMATGVTRYGTGIPLSSLRNSAEIRNRQSEILPLKDSPAGKITT